jgi:hypothetical protein
MIGTADLDVAGDASILPQTDPRHFKKQSEGA